ncbi:MAG: outer membrane protein assembly factor BamC [Enterobacterales bacterium]|nr:outer membrane protein assembly factor BamC [Enterobacterales bacterium]
MKLSLIIATTLLVSGCGYIYGDNGLIKSQKYAYTKAKQDKELVIPAPLKQSDQSDFTIVPPIGEKAKKGVMGKELSQKAPVQLLAVLDNTRVNRDASIPSILVSDNLDFIWQTVVIFMQQHDITLETKDSEKHIAITPWLNIDEGGIWLGINGEDEPDEERAKYKIQVKPGQIKGEYELTVERIGSQIRSDNDLPWQEKTINWGESADMMNLLLSFYDTRLTVEKLKHQRAILAGFKVELAKDAAGNPALVTKAEESLIWEKIPKVMKALGIKIVDKDARQKAYFLEYKAKEDGFFASLFDETVEKLALEDGEYQLVIGEIGELTSLTFKDGEGHPISAELLVKLFPELSRLFGDRR